MISLLVMAILLLQTPSVDVEGVLLPLYRASGVPVEGKDGALWTVELTAVNYGHAVVPFGPCGPGLGESPRCPPGYTGLPPGRFVNPGLSILGSFDVGGLVFFFRGDPVIFDLRLRGGIPPFENDVSIPVPRVSEFQQATTVFVAAPPEESRLMLRIFGDGEERNGHASITVRMAHAPFAIVHEQSVFLERPVSERPADLWPAPMYAQVPLAPETCHSGCLVTTTSRTTAKVWVLLSVTSRDGRVSLLTGQ